MPNFNSGVANASAPTNVLIGVTDTTAVAENNNRVGLVLTNISGSTMYLALMGMRSTLHAGIVLLPSGGNWSMDEYNWNTSQVNAIAHSAGNILCVQEFIR